MPEAEEIELIDEENYAYNIIEILCVDNILIEYKREAVKYWICEIKISKSFISKTISMTKETTEDDNRLEKLRYFSRFSCKNLQIVK